jgi:hypothetical protein
MALAVFPKTDRSSSQRKFTIAAIDKPFRKEYGFGRPMQLSLEVFYRHAYDPQ